MQSSEVTYIRIYFDLIQKMKHPIFNFDESMWRISDSHKMTPFWTYLPLIRTFWSLKKGDPTQKLISNIRLSQIYIIRNYSWYRWMIIAGDWGVIGLIQWNITDNARKASLYDLHIFLKVHLHPNSFVVFSVYSRFLQNILLRHIMDFGMFFLDRFRPHISLLW